MRISVRCLAKQVGGISTTNRYHTMRKLNYQLKQLCRRNRDGSFQTQRNREYSLRRIANQLHELGYQHMSVQSLKPKHVEALVKHWMDSGNAIGTIKGRMAHLRWWAEKVQKPNVIKRSNREYDIPNRTYVAKESKAQFLSPEQLSQVRDKYVRMSVELQQLFGLRREESIKFTPSYADQGGYIRLKGSWTKGGRPRVVPILTQQQRDVLDRVRKLVGNGALIPPDKNYAQQKERYHHSTLQDAGLRNLHGLRHGYAQRRYQELTGWEAPVAGGPTYKELASEQKLKDREVRMIVSQELGHGRINITNIYLGK